MKEIQGKIKFGVIPMNKKEENRFIILDNNGYNSLSNDQLKNSYHLSLITEEQAAEFVESDLDWIATDHNGNPELIFKTAKESLISLLKINDVWIKEWCNYKDFDKKSVKEGLDPFDQIQFQNDCPDDLLLIKL